MTLLTIVFYVTKVNHVHAVNFVNDPWNARFNRSLVPTPGQLPHDAY
jgi:hypothetical protein